MVKRYFQHHLNPLHIYCRLRNFGFTQAVGMRMCSLYERFVYKFLAL